MLAGIWLGLALAAGTGGASAGLDEAAKGLLRRAEFEDAQISPNGEYIAVVHHYETGSVVEVLRRSNWEAVATINPGEQGEVGSLAWLGSERVLVSANRSIGPFAMPIVRPMLYLLKIGDKHAKPMPYNFLGTIEGDDTHILVQKCTDYVGDDCVAEIRRLDIGRITGQGEPVATGPVAGSDFTLDRSGQPRFAGHVDKDGRQQLYVREANKAWKILNDSKDSHLYVEPLGIARDDQSAFLLAEQAEGPDVLERYDFATGARSPLLRDSTSDPLNAIYALDGKELIGAVFGPGRPQPRYWQPDEEHSRWRRAISAAFPDANTAIVSASADGQFVVIRTLSDRDPGTYYLFDRQHQKMQLMFRASPWIDPAQQLPTQSLTFRARDGLPLSGFLTLPKDAGTPPPMVVLVHGGPFYLRDHWDYDDETQLLAQHGYAVLRVNFRGSGGFGRNFVERGARQWGAAMQDDITDATRMVIADHLVDGQRVCIYGASYGGYAALMGAAREPQLYRCAIGLAGVYDLNRMYKWGDIRRSDYGMVYLQQMVGQDKAVLNAHSPGSLAASIKIPVLLAHGELDGRVPIDHAKLMRDALKKAGNPAEYVQYPYEGHGLAAFDHRVDFYGRLLHFLDTHIGASSTTAATAATTP